MDQQFAMALVAYLNRALVCNVPTTGVEWDAIRRGLTEIEKIANGQATAVALAKPAPKVVPHPSMPQDERTELVERNAT